MERADDADPVVLARSSAKPRAATMVAPPATVATSRTRRHDPALISRLRNGGSGSAAGEGAAADETAGGRSAADVALALTTGAGLMLATASLPPRPGLLSAFARSSRAYSAMSRSGGSPSS